MTRGKNAARKRWFAGAVLLVFSVSCATTGISTDSAPQELSSDPASPPASSAARSVDVTDVQVRAEGAGETSIVITADGALVDYASFAEHAPPRLIIDLPYAQNAIGRPVNLPAGSPIVRIQTMQLHDRPIPVLRLVFDLNHLLPYRVEVIRNSLQILVNAEVSEQMPMTQGPTEQKRTPKPVVSGIEAPVESFLEPAKAELVQAAQPLAVLPPAVKEETVAPPIPHKPVAPSMAKSISREATGGAKQKRPKGTPLPPSAAAEQPMTPALVTPIVAAANKRLSLDFKDADLDEILWKVIREASGLNIVIAHGLKKREDRLVSVRLDNVEWRQALDVILRTKNLSYEQDGNVIYVGTKSEIQDSKNKRAEEIEKAAQKNLRIEETKRKVEEERRRAEEERRRAEEAERRLAGEPPCARVIRLAHTKAVDMKKHLERLKTRRGSIELEETTNTLIVNEVGDVCQQMAALAKELDLPPKDPFVTKLLKFNYSKAIDLKAHLTTLKTPQGSIIVDERSSQVIVKDLPEAVDRVETLLKQIDIPTPQVLIEARIVEATRKFSQSLGIQWGGTGIPTSPGSTTGSTVFGGSGNSIQFPSGSGLPPTSGGGVPFGSVPLAMNLPVASPHFAVGMTIGSLANRFLVGAQLTAAENEGRIKTLSSPRVATQDNEEAEIKQGTQVPYTTIDSSGRTVVQFQDAFIKLKVKPHITPDGRVAMKVEAERSFPGNRVDFVGGFVFPINTRKATTNVLVQNGSTLVIGGLLQSTETIIEDKVPTFGDIPILGWLFKRRSIGPDERVELLIFLTPSILQESRL
ncbi:type IV pilus secretin PilQ [Candidatus Methylomirabilis sp.]|uniref:type IV pilus secretin PilQ n=1 Tax=Candidatus Methylomirabilis sp. TaxID=2032687 RepID=UPI00307644B0